MDVIVFNSARKLLDCLNDLMISGFEDPDILQEMRELNEALSKQLDAYLATQTQVGNEVNLVRDGILKLSASYTRQGFDRQRAVLHGYGLLLTGFSKWTSRVKYVIEPE